MPYNVAPSTPPAMSSSGNWMTLAQIISGLVGTGSTPTPTTAAQSSAITSGQGPLAANAASAWQGGLTNTLTNFGGNGITPPAPTPGYNTNQFGVPLGAPKNESY